MQSPGNNAKLQTYLEKVGHDNLAFGIDLSQNAKHRCRVARETRMTTLTKNLRGLVYKAPAALLLILGLYLLYLQLS